MKKDDLPKVFLLNIMHKKNRTWQGKICYPSWKNPQTFKSYLELTRILEQEIGSNNKIKTEEENDEAD